MHSDKAEDVDWSSVEQVSQLVSRTTLSAMQQLWRQHASGMDELGRVYARRMYDTHSQAVRDIAEVKAFDLKRVLQLLNSFTEVTRELVLGVMQTTRGAFARNLRAALEVRDAWYREKLRGLRQRHDSQLAAVRHAAAVELQQRQMQLKIALARTLAKSARGENPSFAIGMLAARVGADAGSAQLPSAATGTGSSAAANAATSDGSPPGPNGSSGTGGVGTTSIGHSMDASVPIRSSAAAALAAVTAAANSVHGGGLSDAATAVGSGVARQELGPEAAMLEELFEDANAADALNRELEASLARANAELLEMREKEAAAEASQWRNKWVVESTKTDSIKRESMAIIAKCEEHLTQLQQHHIAEISQRDYLLQRCRDTIAALEARVGAAPSDAPQPGAPAGP
ncbi:hypothetical protein GPECTOR_7g1183 [Gonium pectorale]|uniref:Uncharacterized protein n=1 Tax=Gonium pectorale TaxID=33097 RepID=A0A150GTX7_GONPE|nr:hypothetical protein GPECTOR_7g1183 [Gonium pectorale]|eukprot:KXZ53289.1 hypothetical protein GPECTOR_7g1183 [Gonium pectorale]